MIQIIGGEVTADLTNQVNQALSGGWRILSSHYQVGTDNTFFMTFVLERALDAVDA